jgi:hypothetical protein
MKPEVVLTEDELPTAVMQAIKQGRKVVAIKLLRESTGIGMANAKVLVDRATSKHAPKPPRQAFMRDYNPTNTRMFTMLLLLAIAFAAYEYFIAT